MPFCFLSVFIILAVSCYGSLGTRSVDIVIPIHQWEKQSTSEMWYTLKWTSGDEILEQHISNDVRKIRISVNPGESVIVCAYPLDRLNPLGAIISPLDSENIIALDADMGWFANILINTDRNISKAVNPQKIIKQALSLTKDVRTLDSVTLLKDILNGKLSDDSFICLEKAQAGPFTVPDGFWISENINDPSFTVSDNLTPSFEIPIGTYCWYCQDLELELVVTSDGSSSPVCSTRRTKMT